MLCIINIIMMKPRKSRRNDNKIYSNNFTFDFNPLSITCPQSQVIFEETHLSVVILVEIFIKTDTHTSSVLKL